ncbi:MAG: GAF domain-containing protein [Deltaproteobacteria bacterium]|nr:MAG: GAF domain-containing protein [Deltaproteobacteria bacterium]
MPTYEIRWMGAKADDGRAVELSAPQQTRATDWMDALGIALDRYGLDQDTLHRAVCLLQPDGTIDVTDPDSNTRFEVQQVSDSDEDSAELPSLDSAWVQHDLADLDAPSPQVSQAYGRLQAMTPDTMAMLARELDALPRSGDAERFARSVLDVLLRFVPAESASVLALDPMRRRIRFLAVRGPAAEALRGVSFPAGRGIAGLVLRTGTSLLVREVAANPNHYPAIDRAVGYATRTLLAVPYRRAGQPCGVIELLNPFGGGSFTEGHRHATERAARRLEQLLG